MFFDFSEHKVLFISAIVSMLAIGVFFFSLTSPTWNHLRLSIIYASEREWSELTYWTKFKLPEQTRTLAASVGIASPVEASVPAPSNGNAVGVPVLLYHGEGPSSPMPYSVFVEQLRALKEAGWQTITLKQFTDFMKRGTPVPAKSFLLTFDDGRRDTFYPADPVLKDLGYTAVMFVITGFSLPVTSQAISTFYLDQMELEHMVKSGRWELQSHGDQDHREYEIATATSTPGNVAVMPGEHFLSNKFWVSEKNRLETDGEYEARILHDLTGSKGTLEEKLGIEINSYAYPFNDFGQGSVNFKASQSILTHLVPSVYDFAFYQTWEGNGDTFIYPDPNAYFIKRIEPIPEWTGKDLLAVLGEGSAKELPYRATSFGDDWQSGWGSMTNGPSLSLAASSSTTGAVGFLNGTESWSDYSFTMSGVWNRAEAVSLLARHSTRATPYVACAFSHDHIFVQQRANGTTTNLASVAYEPSGGSTVTLGLTVEGHTVRCNASGKSVSAQVRADVPLQGGVGVEIWDRTPGVANLNVKSIEARAL